MYQMGWSNDVMDAKKSLRLRLRALRDAVPQLQHDHLSVRICDRAAQLPSLRGAHRVALYAGIGSEVQTRWLFATLRERGCRVAYPRVVARGELVFAWVDDLTHLLPGYRAIPEPAAAGNVPLEDLDAIIVPGVGFDRRGHRIGYGSGCYDRVLGRYGGPTIALAFACQLCDVVPAEDHDRRVTIVVCEDVAINTEEAIKSPADLNR